MAMMKTIGSMLSAAALLITAAKSILSFIGIIGKLSAPLA
jgi:hypothetical protein